MKKPTNEFTGKSLVFTGKMRFIKEINREKIMYRLLCEAAGIEFKPSVSKNVDFVVTGQEPGPAKIKKANELISTGHHIKVIDENTFILMYFGLEKLPEYINEFY